LPDIRWGISNPGRLDYLRAVHHPHRHIAAGVVPENVAHAVAVEVALSDDRPRGGGIGNDRSLLDPLRAGHHPYRHIAAGVAPENVALAVVVEVMGGGGHLDYLCQRL